MITFQFLMLPGHVIPFGKDLMRQTECWEWIFDLGPRCQVAGVERGGVGGGLYFWRILQFCIKQTPPEIEF